MGLPLIWLALALAACHTDAFLAPSWSAAIARRGVGGLSSRESPAFPVAEGRSRLPRYVFGGAGPKMAVEGELVVDGAMPAVEVGAFP